MSEVHEDKPEPTIHLHIIESLIFLTTDGSLQCYVDNLSRSTERGMADSNGPANLARAKTNKCNSTALAVIGCGKFAASLTMSSHTHPAPLY